MTDRSTESTTTRTATGRPSTGKKPAPGSKPSTRGLGERISSAMGQATDEHRANADPRSKAAAKQSSPGGKPPRRARLRLTRIDPWSVMKTSFLLAIAFGVVTVVSVFIIWSVLSAAGVWDSINSIVQQAVGSDTSKPFEIQEYVGTSRILGFTMIVAVIDVILITAIATLGAFLYNLSAALLGGIEVTLAEDN